MLSEPLASASADASTMPAERETKVKMRSRLASAAGPSKPTPWNSIEAPESVTPVAVGSGTGPSVGSAVGLGVGVGGGGALGEAPGKVDGGALGVGPGEALGLGLGEALGLGLGLGDGTGDDEGLGLGLGLGLDDGDGDGDGDAETEGEGLGLVLAEGEAEKLGEAEGPSEAVRSGGREARMMTTPSSRTASRPPIPSAKARPRCSITLEPYSLAPSRARASRYRRESGAMAQANRRWVRASFLRPTCFKA